MADILHDLPMNAPAAEVFDAITLPEGLDKWWTKRSAGVPEVNTVYELFFGSEYEWAARVTRCIPLAEFEFEITDADGDWLGTRVGFDLEPRGSSTWVQFRHENWSNTNAHFRISSNCWALYLRLLRRYLEYGEVIDYERRLDV